MLLLLLLLSILSPVLASSKRFFDLALPLSPKVRVAPSVRSGRRRLHGPRQQLQCEGALLRLHGAHAAHASGRGRVGFRGWGGDLGGGDRGLGVGGGVGGWGGGGVGGG